ncbi:YcgL domain-containing protein [Litoribacillus peritrichatus]|uniref:YcgL domain-containing protein GCM10022277_37560 n=1 Tax=Litoribacillus peritrichatus TaxID=718191 RepID=A0ABP7N5X9_9GAMM
MKVCSIYKSPRRDEMYLYIEKLKGLKELPEALLEVFGKPIHVMDMLVKPDSKLSRVEAEKVLEDIASKGFFLQMPPPKEDYLLDLYDPNQAD